MISNLNFHTTKREAQLIVRIVDRAIRLSAGLRPLDVAMSVTACHCNGYPLDLEALADSDDLHFSLDMIAILSLLDHETGKMPDGIKLSCRVKEEV
jgi:hypothetical protein